MKLRNQGLESLIQSKAEDLAANYVDQRDQQKAVIDQQKQQAEAIRNEEDAMRSKQAYELGKKQGLGTAYSLYQQKQQEEAAKNDEEQYNILMHMYNGNPNMQEIEAAFNNGKISEGVYSALAKVASERQNKVSEITQNAIKLANETSGSVNPQEQQTPPQVQPLGM